jgi:hypothetical protein
VNLALVGMQQDGAAAAAGIIHRMLARCEHGRSVQDDADFRRGDYFKGNTSAHDVLPYRQAGALPNSQPPTPGTEGAADDGPHIILYSKSVSTVADTAPIYSPRRIIDSEALSHDQAAELARNNTLGIAPAADRHCRRAEGD